VRQQRREEELAQVAIELAPAFKQAPEPLSKHWPVLVKKDPPSHCEECGRQWPYELHLSICPVLKR
jgi:hypothetical protein